MKIVVLDGYTLNPGDLDWAPLHSLGECLIRSRTAPEEIVTYAADAEIVLTNKTPLRAEALAKLPRLRYIGVLATGYNVIDTAAAKERDIVVSNVPSYGTSSVAQHVFALLLELTQHVGHHAETVRAGEWSRCADFCYWQKPLVELDGLTLGIIGYGRIARAVANIARAFGMRVIAFSRSETAEVERVSLDELFRRSDVVSLHCPLTPETKGMVDATRFASMKPGAYLINTSRGPLINEANLASALNRGVIAGAALDVLAQEPPPSEHPLFSAKNCLITPHIAWATRAARERLLNTAVANLQAFCAGRPQNVVS